MLKQLIKNKSEYILYDADVVENPELLGFDAKYWAAQNGIIGFAEGRGTTFFIQVNEQSYVLRHYLRGGMIARYSRDRYIWLGLKRSRAWREWHLLAQMRELGLPVPRPVACRVIREGLTYTADIMTVRIQDATTFTEEISRHELAEGYWVALGCLIKRFHLNGIYHADLNANNVLLDQGGRFYLIDFDRGRFRRPARYWQQANLSRLRSSLDKLKAKSDVFYFTETDWSNLIIGYESTGLD